MFLDFPVNDLRVETHGGDIEGVAVDQPGRIGLHDVHGRFQGIRHIHHVHVGTGCDRADKLFSFHGSVVNLYGVIRRSATRQGHMGNQPGEPDRTGIYPIFVEIIVTQQFRGDLGDTVHGAGALDGVLRGPVVRRFRTERPDGTGCEDSDMLLSGNFQDIQQSVHLDIPCHQRFPFGDCGKQGGKIVNRIDVVFLDDGRELSAIQDICFFGGTAFQQNSLGLRPFDVSGNNLTLRKKSPQFHGQFRSDLSGGSNYKYIFHVAWNNTRP